MPPFTAVLAPPRAGFGMRPDRRMYMSINRSFPATSHVFCLPPTVAAATLDVMILDPAVAADLIPAGPLHRAEPTGYRPLRLMRGTLRLPGRWDRTVAVTLELLPWSDQRSELTISSTARPHLPVERNVGAYVWAAQHALTTLAELITTGQPVMIPQRRLQLPAGADSSDIRQLLVGRRSN
jgi:hypothetical protein